MPRSPRSADADSLSAFWTELQHWMGPVLHWLAGCVAVAVAVMVTVVGFPPAGFVVGEPPGMGVAAARMGRARRATYLLNNIVLL